MPTLIWGWFWDRVSALFYQRYEIRICASKVFPAGDLYVFPSGRAGPAHWPSWVVKCPSVHWPSSHVEMLTEHFLQCTSVHAEIKTKATVSFVNRLPTLETPRGPTKSGHSKRVTVSLRLTETGSSQIRILVEADVTSADVTQARVRPTGITVWQSTRWK